jgi:hypothetical protein
MPVFIGPCRKDKDPKEAKTSLSVDETSSSLPNAGHGLNQIGACRWCFVDWAL